MMKDGHEVQATTGEHLQMPKHVAEDLTEVLDYLWEDEQTHYQYCKESGQEVGHIFESMQRVRAWFEGSSIASEENTNER